MRHIWAPLIESELKILKFTGGGLRGDGSPRGPRMNKNLKAFFSVTPLSEYTETLDPGVCKNEIENSDKKVELNIGLYAMGNNYENYGEFYLINIKICLRIQNTIVNSLAESSHYIEVLYMENVSIVLD